MRPQAGVDRLKPVPPHGRGSDPSPERQRGVSSEYATVLDCGSLRDILAEVEGRAAGEARGEAGILQQVAEEVIVHQVALCPPGEVVPEVDVEAAAETDEKDVVGLARPGDQSAHQGLDYPILRLWGRDFIDRKSTRLNS